MDALHSIEEKPRSNPVLPQGGPGAVMGASPRGSNPQPGQREKSYLHSEMTDVWSFWFWGVSLGTHDREIEEGVSCAPESSSWLWAKLRCPSGQKTISEIKNGVGTGHGT